MDVSVKRSTLSGTCQGPCRMKVGRAPGPEDKVVLRASSQIVGKRASSFCW